MAREIRWAVNFEQWNPDDREFEAACARVQSEEQARIKRFVFRKDAKAALVGMLVMLHFNQACWD
jgi:4'-phosphopantetheinyl transferase